jgi:hypothetical protein
MACASVLCFLLFLLLLFGLRSPVPFDGLRALSLPKRSGLGMRLLLVMLLLLGHPSAQERAQDEDRGRSDNTESAWANLDSPKTEVRAAARKKIEAQPFGTWKSRAIGETRPWASIEALLALCHACQLSKGAALRPHLCEGITTLRIEEMSAEQMLAAVRLTRLVCTRFGKPTEDERQQMIDLWSRFVPPQTAEGEKGRREIAGELKELLSLLAGAH